MRRRVDHGALPCAWLVCSVLGCQSNPAPVHPISPPKPQQFVPEAGVSARRVERMHGSADVDPARAEQVPLVLRVRLLAVLGANKFAWARVRVLGVLKNTSNQAIGSELQVAYYSWAQGVPEGESTLYLEPYSDAPDHPWRLLEGTGERGVSHPR